MTTTVSGGGGGGGYPGVTTDGNNGLIIEGAITSGTPNLSTPTVHTFHGAMLVRSGTAELNDSQATMYLEQSGTLEGDRAVPSLVFHRIIDHVTFHVTSGMIVLQEDSTNLPADELITNFNGFMSYINTGLGQYDNVPPLTPTSITGALSSVTDAAAKVVLTRLIAAAIADGTAIDNTT